MSSFYISAAHKSSGKTTLSIGISAAIRQRGLSIQSFKKGPDYIDPIWLSQATGRPCYNLDFFTSGRDFILNQYNQYRQQKDVVLVEGNMGLFDGMALDGSDSNAAMARLLNIPVILVVDTSGTSRGIAPLLNGYQSFDKDIQYAGVILNKVAGSRHQSKLTNVIREYTDFNILGSVPRNSDIQVTERHLGLIPGYEMEEASNTVIDLLATRVRENIDIDALLSIKTEIPASTQKQSFSGSINKDKSERLKIAVAMDKAFGFYYPGDLQQFEQQVVEIVPFNCIKDSKLPPQIDGLFIGGGFPETQLEKLSLNKSMLGSIKEAIEGGLPTYAECGGLMYLCDQISYENKTFPMCNVIEANVEMHKRPQGRGYVVLESTDSHPWLSNEKQTIKAHEFHYSALNGLPKNTNFAYTIKRGAGIDSINDGIILHNMIASYSHLRQTDECSWVDNFVSFVKRCNGQSKK
ncbi:MAG: hydrogenobyrinic acid a,c-diamide synthase (glutamine-hydrolyzing) [Gammaproteobacteria bacterium]|nr:hydrogenobyrinic acid a,c-diamide synthase (glutamine-hydrolyzing) [Gammaproteobacteria bacterium]MBT3721970.1 hydrogenobyrinic acid a,c-diamide synthase (glutamine-hydrolyzing) [Gammaproteobacteria bacterium]MBT4078829.1 hydrogenobyrinic acid a,c-diamide synthase (glutamine-hydrolyzing) [Gammaproteobacteria bacterium]MBT4193267.1 hydrogenobyrinic acid a,c-diamide synthase (glutamine-hydrolyzing) [Gammaproteobacteria bacterium]MBT4451296.1 hydrogenobyrinic acid a,c-diamide synthase (glutamin